MNILRKEKGVVFEGIKEMEGSFINTSKYHVKIINSLIKILSGNNSE